MQEIEAKFYVRDLKRIESRIRELDARLIQPRVLETNLRFDLPDGGLRSKGQVLRLRRDTEVKLTYKGAGTSAQGIVNRTEIEFTVEDFAKAKSFLEALGYQKIFQYDKYRTTYEVERCHIMLDELPFGNFVEIEGADITAIHDIASQLNLNMQAAISESYASLFERLRQALGIVFVDITFANFEGLLISPKDLQVQTAD
jgi:adenylate cyclase, class 2